MKNNFKKLFVTSEAELKGTLQWRGPELAARHLISPADPCPPFPAMLFPHFSLSLQHLDMGKTDQGMPAGRVPDTYPLLMTICSLIYPIPALPGRQCCSVQTEDRGNLTQP